jgi:putative membrane protein
MFYEFWWIFPVIMIVLCFLMMWGRSGSMMCGFGPRDGSRFTQGSDSAMDILDKRYARGEIDQREYEEKKEKLIQTKRGA